MSGILSVWLVVLGGFFVSLQAISEEIQLSSHILEIF